MVKFAVYLQVKQGKQEDFLAAVRDFIPTVKKESGTIRYDLCQSTDDPTSFIFYEVYKNEKANTAHTDSPQFKAFFEKIGPLMSSPPAVHPVIESVKG